MVLKLGMQHCGLVLYKVFINNDHWLTVTYFMARSNLVTYAFEWVFVACGTDTYAIMRLYLMTYSDI